MSESCNFQNLNQNCFELCLSSGCTLDLLINNECDAICNTNQCGWDYGSCGYCTKNCFLEDLPSCKSSCLVPECLISSACQESDECDPGCKQKMLGNGECNQECLTRNCNFDLLDCVQLQISENCYLFQVGDGICDSSCFNDQAFWDGWDCSCAAGCTDELLKNNVCDSDCNTEKCNFDSQKCLECAPGCKGMLLGDGKCDLQCLTTGCFFDLGDCDCDKQCNTFLIGNQLCDAGCNSVSCGYDAGKCVMCTETCDSSKRHNGKCDSECDAAACLFDDFDCICSVGCYSYLKADLICDDVCNTFECNYDSGVCLECASGCSSFLRGDGKCDPQCNNPNCLYDNFDCLCQPGCTTEKLNNEICDIECNHYLCNFDNLKCKPCLCDQRLLANGVCDLDCNTSECQFDAGDCGCPSSCTLAKLSNLVCDFECNSPLCNYDNFKCTECAPGCRWSDVNNGKCQVPCTVSECGFDGSDCSCSENCQVASVFNFKCDAGCNRSKCLYDNQACVECAPGCSVFSVNNGICQAECFVSACGFDGFDCLCSKYCQSTTTCDHSCLTAECDYSRNVCENSEILRNLVFTGINPASSSYWQPETCENFNPSCLSLIMNENCDNVCNVKECLWDLGACSTCTNTLCKQCIGDYCVRCVDGFFSFWGTCLEYIPASASVYSDRPWFLMPRPETSSAGNPMKIYVSAYKQSRIETGRISNPFSSLSVALSSIYSKFANIYLMKGFHILKEIDLTNPNVLNKASAFFLLNTIKSYKMITISTLLCSEAKVEGCSDEPAVVLYTNPKVFFLVQFSGTLIIKNLIFNGGLSLWPTCMQENCYYCPYLKQRNSVFYNDKDQPINPKLFATNCEDNRSRSFISFASGGTFYMTNVTFYNFRQQFKSIIDISRVAATFVNVSFMYVQASNSSNGAVIFQKEGSLVWVLGMAKFLNYGYESVNGLNLSPLLSAQDSTVIKLKYLLYDWNLVLGVDSALLKLQNIQNFAFEYSQVTFNRGENLIQLQVSKNGQMMHSVITNLKFSNNLAEGGSLIMMDFSEVPRTVFIDRCEFSNNTLESGLGLINLKSKQVNSFYTSEVLLSNLKFEFNSGGRVSCLNIEDLFSVNLTSIQILPERPSSRFPSETWVNTSKSLGYYFKVYKPVTPTPTLSALQIVGIKTEVFIQNLQVQGHNSAKVVLLRRNHKLHLNFGQFLFNFPSHSVVFMEENNDTFLSNSQFLNTSSLLSCLYLLNQANNQLFQVQFTGNKVLEGTVSVDNSDLTITKSQFTENSADKGSGLFIKLASRRTLSLYQVQFSLNTADEGTLFVSHSEVTEKLLTLLLNMNFFLNNSAGSGSGLFAESLTLSGSSFISNSQFQFNKGSKLGVLVLKENTIHLNNCQLRLNQAQQASALYFENLLNSETSSWITNSVFSNNSGESVIYASSLQVFTQLMISGVAFINNTGHCLQVFKSYVELNSTYFIANSYTHAPCVHSTNSKISMKDSEIMYNQGSDIGALRISSYSVISIFNCTFYFNIGYNGGCMYVSELGQFSIANTKFLNNISPGYGSALFILDTGNNRNTIKNSTISNNIIGISGVLSSLGGSVEFYDTIIQGNTAYGFSPGISSSMGNVTMYRCLCSSQSGWVGSFVSSTSLSHIKLYDSVFRNSSAAQGGALLISTSYVTAVNCSFSNTSAELGGVAQIMSASEGYFFNSTTENSTASDFGGIFNIIQSNLTLINSSFKGFRDKGIYADKATLINIKNSSFSEGFSSENGGFLLCVACTEIFINETTVSAVSSFKGGALSIVFQENQKKPSCFIENSVFTNISAATAGVISSVDYHLSIKSSEFYNNSAVGSAEVWGSGGVVQSSCELNNECELVITESVFMYNSARENGGCIEWDGKEPRLTDNLFQDNSAKYGNNIASFPVRLRLFRDGEIVDFINLTQVAPGQKVQDSVSVVLVDHYEQIVMTDNLTSASLGLNNSESFVTGDTSVVSSNGLITFNDFLIYADTNSVQSLLVTAESIQSSVSVEVYMRNCSIGESFSNGACLACSKGQYNLQPNGPCLECPSSAYCFGNYSIVPKKNYWRSGMYSTNFHRCPLIDTCLGGKDDASLTGKCAKGYTSNLCQSCESGYSRSTGNLCQKCPDMNKNIAYLSIIVVFIILVVCGLVYVNISMANKPASNYTILIKILLNYIQIIGIVASMNLDWPDFALDYLKIQETAGSLSQQSFSFDCFVSEKYNRTNSQVYFDKIILYLMMPTVLAGICLFLWSLVGLVKLDSKYIKNHFVGSVVIIALLLHSIIIKICFSPFSCRDIEGDLFLNDDLSIRCWTGSHRIFTLTVALPGAIIWGVFVPGILLFFMIRNKKFFDELPIKQRYGFVISGYQHGTYYWEIVILYRKTLVITASIVFGAISTELQTLSVLIILLIASYMQSDLKPFLGDSMNKMEFRSILVSIVTIYCGLYYLAPDVSWTGRIILFVILVLLNSAFFSYWTYYFVKDFSVSAWKFIKDLLQRRRKSVVPESSNHTPEFKHSEALNEDSEHIIDTSENHDDGRLSMKKSLREEEKVEDLDDDEQELDNSAVFIKEGRKINAVSLVVKPANKVQAKDTRNTVRYNAFADDSD